MCLNRCSCHDQIRVNQETLLLVFLPHANILPCDRVRSQRLERRHQLTKGGEISCVHFWDLMIAHRCRLASTSDPLEWVSQIARVVVHVCVAYRLSRCCLALWGEWWRLCIDLKDICEGTDPCRLCAPGENIQTRFYSQNAKMSTLERSFERKRQINKVYTPKTWLKSCLAVTC